MSRQLHRWQKSGILIVSVLLAGILTVSIPTPNFENAGAAKMFLLLVLAVMIKATIEYFLTRQLEKKADAAHDQPTAGFFTEPSGPQFGAELVNLTALDFTPSLLARIPAKLARQYRVLPVAMDSPHRLAVAMADPLDLNAIDSLTHYLNCELEIRTADPQQLDLLIRRLYQET